MKKRGLRSCDLADSLAATFFTSSVIGKGAAIFELARRRAEALKAKAIASRFCKMAISPETKSRSGTRGRPQSPRPTATGPMRP